MRKLTLLTASLALCALLARAQAPLAKPLADFDKLVSELKISNVISDPIRIGDTAVIPFAKIKFGMGGGQAMVGFGGGMGAKTIPLGVLIVEGDDVRAELFPEQQEKPTALQEFLQAVRERKVTFMVNGLNIGNAPGNVQDLAPLVSAMMGQTTVMTNGLNLGNLTAPRGGAAPTASTAPSKDASADELKKLIDARKFADALPVVDALIAKDPKNAELHVRKGNIMGLLAQGSPGDLIKYGMGAMQEYETALSLDPKNPEAHYGRGIGRMMAPPAFGGDMDGAIADFQAVIAQKPSPEVYCQLGEAFRHKGLNDKAAAAYRKALELRPNDPQATKALAALK